MDESILRELSVSEVSNICMITLTDHGGIGEYTLRELARNLERKAERIDGVRKGKLMGARDRELRVYVDKDKAQQFDITLEEISGAIARNNINLPGGTFSGESERETTVRGLGNFVSPEGLANTVIRKNRDGHHTTLAEIAEVVPDFEKRRSFGYLDGRPAILIGISKNSGSDIGEVVGRIRELVNQESPSSRRRRGARSSGMNRPSSKSGSESCATISPWASASWSSCSGSLLVFEIHSWPFWAFRFRSWSPC